MTQESSSTNEPIGVIGLGFLGAALCHRLLDAGEAVRCFNRTREKAEPLLERGAVWSDNPFSDSRRIVVCLYTSEIVHQSLQEFSPAFRSGQVVLDATTGGPEDAVQLGGWLSESGVDYLETPIAASSEQTRRGEATAFVGGAHSVYEQNKDLLSCLMAHTHYVGEWGAAASFKLVNNLILGLNRAALAEGLAFAEQLGLQPVRTLEVLKQCNSYSGVMDTKGDKMVRGDFTTQARLTQHAKDVRIIIAEASKYGLRLPLSQAHLSMLLQAEQMGLGEQDNSAIIRAFQNDPQSVQST